ncbi:ABC transporter permease [Citricoccus sp. NPDC055426]|uniref:ABC transporter permease n=1 Tax=Citricoccus sp. NPDC055426 TaxID=3155536 RepID=UPI00344AAC46
MTGTLRTLGQTWAIPILLVVLWEVLTRTEVLDPRFFIPLGDIAVTTVEELVNGRLGSDLLTTLRRLGFAFALAAVAGVGLGIASGHWRLIEWLTRPITDTLYPLPKIAILPLFIIIVGRGEVAFILTAFATGFFQIIISTRGSVRNVSPELIEAGRNFGATGHRYFTRFLFPAIAPQLFNGLRLGLATCLITLIAAEFVGSDSGLGSMIHRAGQQFAVDEMYAGLVLVGLLGLVVSLLFRALEPLLLPWQRGISQNGTGLVASGG